MPAVVNNATRIWEVNIHWDLYAQCGIWDQKGKGVDIWECIRARESRIAVCRFLLILTRFVCRCRLLHARHSATKQYLLEICGSKIDLSPPTRSQVATYRTLHPNGRVRRSFLAMRGFPPPVSFPGAVHPINQGFSMHICGAGSSPTRVHPSVEYNGDSGTGRRDVGSLTGIFRFVFPFAVSSSFSSRVFSFGGSFSSCAFSLASSLLPTSAVSHCRRLLLSCATSPIYRPLCRSVHICRSIARIRLFINYGTSLLLSIHVSNPVVHYRDAPPTKIQMK